MDGATNNHSGASSTKITGDRQTSPAPIETVSRLLFSSDYYRKVDRTTDIAGRLPNAVYTLPPRLVQAIVGRAELSAVTREALVAGCKKFFLASREYDESKEVFVDWHGDGSTTIALDCGRLYSEGNNRFGQCGIGSEEYNVTGPRLIRLPPVLEVWHHVGRWFANTTRGLYAWGWNDDGGWLGVGDDEHGIQPRRVPIDGDVLDVSMLPGASFFRTASGWHGCGSNRHGRLGLVSMVAESDTGWTVSGWLGRPTVSGQLGIGQDKVTTPAPIPGSERVTRWGGNYATTFGFCDAGILSCGRNVNGQCGVGSTIDEVTALTPVALPDDVKGRVGQVDCDGGPFFISGRRCFGCGYNGCGQLGIGSDERRIFTPIELPVPVDVIITRADVTVIRSGNTLLACGDNRNRQIFTNNTPKITTPTPLDLPGPVVKCFLDYGSIFIQLEDGAWVGRGIYYRHHFTPVPKADLIDEAFLPGWTPVNDNCAEKLNALEADDDVMILPEPVANA